MTTKKRKLGRGVSVIGGAMSQFGVFPEKNNRDLMAEAYGEALGSVDRGLDPQEIDAVYVGNFASELFEALLSRARREELDCCFAVAAVGDLPEPVCAVYHRRCLAPMTAALAAGRRRVIAFLDFELEDGRAVRSGSVAAGEPAHGAAGSERVMNLNTPEEWERECAREREQREGGAR